MLAALTPVKTEPIIFSKRLNLKGSPSKIVCFEGANVPSIIRPGSCPIQGVWASDRIHIAALALLLESETGKEIPFGFVEYVSFGIIRKVVIRSSDRREVLKICRRVEKIKAGFMPEKTEEKFCRNAPFQSTVFRILPSCPSFLNHEWMEKLQHNKKQKQNCCSVTVVRTFECD